MQRLHSVFIIGYSIISVLFIICAAALILLAVLSLWQVINPANGNQVSPHLNSVLQSIALLTVSVAALELGQTILEEEVLRTAHVSAPTRVRRFLSRFMIVLVVSLSIETLVAVFRFVEEDPAHLPNAASIGLAAGVLLAAWGIFIKLNRSAEELEPEAMEQAKREDEKIDSGRGAATAD